MVQLLLLLKILALVILIFAIDTIPVVVKLTAQTGYDHYLKKLARDRTLDSIKREDEHYSVVIGSTQSKNDLLIDYMKHLGNKMKELYDEPNDTQKDAENIRFLIIQTLLKNTENMLWENEQAGQDPPSGSIFTAIKHAYWILKQKFSTLF